jgi:hypothetical protein
MIYTNRNNLPEEVFKVLSKERYSSGDTDYSVTTLKSPPRIVQLERRHEHEIESDAIDNLWSMFGQMAHNLLEEHGSDEALTEERIYMDILGRKISGAIDHFKDGIITDYKVTSAWTLVYGSRVKEWEEQLNMYAYLLRASGHDIRRIRIVAILRDWDKNKAKASHDYPQSPIEIIPITLWSEEEQKVYIEERVYLQVQAEDKSDESLPLCIAEEMWEQPSKYAIMKEGNKKATKVFDEEQDAEDFINGPGDHPHKDWRTLSIVKRPGKRTRCEDYCDVNCFCSQYKEYLASKESATEDSNESTSVSQM